MVHKIFLTAIVVCLLFRQSGHSQSSPVFAPVPGAEWKYFYITNWWDIPYFLGQREGIVTIRYEKDTAIQNISMKKLTQTEIVRFRSTKDTAHYQAPVPIFMTQRRDSVFVWSDQENALILGFVYNQTPASAIKHRTFSNENVKYAIRLDSISNFKFPDSDLTFTRYNCKTLTDVLDLHIINPVIILDRIGPITADITHVQSNLIGYNGAGYYRLICYKDAEVGELVLEPTGCNNRLISVKTPSTNANEYFSCAYDGSSLRVYWKNTTNTDVKMIELFDASDNYSNMRL